MFSKQTAAHYRHLQSVFVLKYLQRTLDIGCFYWAETWSRKIYVPQFPKSPWN